MATTETKENKAIKGYEVYPGGELFSAINRMLTENTPVKIVFAGDVSGDVVFSVKFADLGLDNSLVALSHPFYRTNSFGNFLGKILLLNNMDMFADRLMSKKNYNDLVKSYVHRNFGLKIHKNEEFLFHFHISLFFNLQNQLLSQTINDEVAKITPAIIHAKKVKREEESQSLCTYSDSDGLKLTVPKTSELRICLENAMETILDFYGVKNKDVLVTNNQFSFQIDVTDKGK